MKKIFFIWIGMLGFMGSVLAQNMPPGKWWQAEPVIRNLGLQRDQIERIEAIFRQNAKTMIDLKAEVEKNQVDLGILMDVETPDKDKVLTQVDQLESARARMSRMMTSMLVDVRRIITLEQWRKLQTMRPMNAEPGRVPGVNQKGWPRPRLGQEPLPQPQPQP